ncbi:MAG: CRISPR-associated endonuclease Cas2 [Candidatus Zixiibacteriota bacterium]
MWLFAMFDLPVDSPAARRQYTNFRKSLLKQGFTMLQYSVYSRYCNSEERATVFRERLKKTLPPQGEVRLLAVTDHQFGKMQVFLGKKRAQTEKPPEQLLLF